MSTPKCEESDSPNGGRCRVARRLARARRNLSGKAQIGARQAEAEVWTRLEEREYGRLALEADYLFDTSYPWAA